MEPSFETPPAAAPQDERGVVRQATENIRFILSQTLRAGKARVSKGMAAKTTAHPRARKIAHLARLRGIGPEFAPVLAGRGVLVD